MAALLILGIFGFSALYGLFRFTDADSLSVSPYTVVFVLPENAGLHYTLALNLVSDMDSLSGLCSVQKTTSEEEARSMLEDGTASAVVLIPEAMIHSIMTGSNDLPATILYPGEPSLETVLFRQVVDSMAQMLASAQTGIYALYELYDAQGASEQEQETANSQLNSRYISQVLNRAALFREESSDAQAQSAAERLLISGSALLFLLSGISLCFFLLPAPDALAAALGRLRLSVRRCLLTDFFIAFLCQFLLFLIFYLAAAFAAHLGFFSLKGTLLCAPGSAALLALFSSAFQTLLCRLCRSAAACVSVTTAAALILLYCSGELLPAAFLPDVLRRLSGFLPGAHLCAAVSWFFTGVFSGADAFSLLAETLLFLAAACGLEALNERRFA